MDLGKMLAEALANSPAARVVEGKWDPIISLDGHQALTAAAEAFLVKVRKAETPDIYLSKFVDRKRDHVLAETAKGVSRLLSVVLFRGFEHEDAGPIAGQIAELQVAADQLLWERQFMERGESTSPVPSRERVD